MMDIYKSDSIANIAAALVKAQKKMKHPKRNVEGQVGTRKYKYADLTETIDAVRPALNENGIALVQATALDHNRFSIVTYLLHDSDEFIASEYPLPVNATNQEIGSAITYAKRYCLAALCGIAAEDDDDGAAAQSAPIKAQPLAPETAAMDHAPPPVKPLNPRGDMEAQLRFESAVDDLRNRGTAATNEEWCADYYAQLLEVHGIKSAGELTTKAKQVKFYRELEAWVDQMEKTEAP